MDANQTGPVDPRELARLFRHTTRLMARAHHRQGRGRHAQDHVLALIREQGPLVQADLLEMLDVRSSSLSEVLSKLERAGLIVRERNPEDRRGFVVSATELGRSLGREPQGRGRGADSLFACLDDAERVQFRDILAKLASALRDDSLEQGGPGRGGGPGPGGGPGKGRGMGQGGQGQGGGRGQGRGPGRGGPGSGRGSGRGAGQGRGRKS